VIRPHRIQIRPVARQRAAHRQRQRHHGNRAAHHLCGDLLQYDVEVATGAFRSSGRPTPACIRRRGDQVELGWSAADTLIFEADA